MAEKGKPNYSNLLIFIGLAILIFVLSKIDAGKTIAIISKVSPIKVLVIATVMTAAMGIKGIRWNIIVGQFAKIPNIKAIKYYYAGFFPSLITPGRAGDFLKAFYIRKELGLSKAFGTVLVDRIADIVSMLLFSLVASSAFIVVFSRELVPPWIILLAIAAFLVFIYAFFRSRHVEKLIGILVEKFAPERYKERLGNSYSEIKKVMKASSKPKVVFVGGAISILSWLAVLVASYFLLAEIAEADFVLVMIAVPLMALSDLLPLSFLGIGTREGVLGAIFLAYGASIETAIAFSFLMQLTGNISLLVVSYVFFLLNPIRIDKDNSGKIA